MGPDEEMLQAFGDGKRIYWEDWIGMGNPRADRRLWAEFHRLDEWSMTGPNSRIRRFFWRIRKRFEEE